MHKAILSLQIKIDLKLSDEAGNTNLLHLKQLTAMLFFLRYTRFVLGFFLVLLFDVSNAQSPNELSYFLSAAEKNSPLLNDYNNQVLITKIDSLKLRANYGFIFSGEGNATYAPSAKGWGYDNALSNSHTLFAGVRVMREFLSRNNLNTRLKNYNLGIAQILAQKNISQQALKKQITDQYITTYSSQKQLAITKEVLHLLEQEDLVLKKLTQVAVFKQTDYLNFKVSQQQNQLAYEQKKVEMEANYALLNYLCGIVDDRVENLQEPIFSQMDALPFDESVYAHSFQADSAKIANDGQLIGYDYKPKISAYADGGYQSSFVLTPYKNFGLSTGISLSIPIYDGHKKKMLLDQNKIQLDSRTQYAAFAKKQYQQQVLQIQNQMKQYSQLKETALHDMKYAETLTEANAKQLPTGDVRTVDFILSVNNLLTLKSMVVQYDTMLLNLENQLQNIVLP